ncbi:MAG: B12-binding domain-containing radical SAM protein [Nitrospirae bacterium]|nr:B12-binding domain-containing radical SAM protein [Nitrospirota bacterium]
MSLKVAMIYPLPSPISPQKNCALSIIYPGRAAEIAGHEVDFWDARLDSEKQMWELMGRADVVALSSLSGFQLGESIRIAGRCKERFPEKPIVWGGVHVTFQPLQSMRESYVDFCVIGEGEARFPKLLHAIEAGKGYKDIDGVAYKRESAGYQPSPEEDERFGIKDSYRPGLRLRPIGQQKEIIEIHDPNGVYEYEGGRILVNRRGLALNLKEEYVPVMSPKTERLFREAARRNEVILQSSRGCNWSPTSCEFCSVGGQYTQWDPETGKTRSVYRYIPYEIWEKDLDDIYNVQSFDFIELEDENSSWFLKDWRYAEHLKRKGVKYHLHLRSDQLKNEERVAKLAETGCLRIHIGAESGNDETLKTMRKNEKVEAHYVAARLLAKHGIEGVYTWIIGNPGETPSQIMDTLRVSDEIRALHPRGRSRATVYVLMPLPGTIAFERAKENGWPLPNSMGEWTKMSAAYNPKLPRWINNIYFVAGFHHNRFHKTHQNFPGWWRLFILPFEMIIEWRWKKGIRTASPTFFGFFDFEYWCIVKLVSWRSKRSTGQSSKDRSQVPKLIERLIPGLAGH